MSVLGPLIIVGVLAYLIASHGHDVSRAAARVSSGDFVLVAALAFVTLLARTEAVVACLNAMGNPPQRVDIHSANSLTFLASTINHYLRSPQHNP